jgi:hypothetical protein
MASATAPVESYVEPRLNYAFALFASSSSTRVKSAIASCYIWSCGGRERASAV